MILSPYARMAGKYRESPQELPFGYYVSWHMVHGFVFSTPDYFIMGRPVRRGTDFTDRLFIEPRESADAWYVHAMSGDVSAVWGILPYPLPFIAFERVRVGKRELTIVPLERIRRLSLSAP
jgi:hypothetical protein